MSNPIRTIVIFEFSDYERELVADYQRRVQRRKGVPPVARRVDLRTFVHEALENHWLAVEDAIADKDELEERTRRRVQELRKLARQRARAERQGHAPSNTQNVGDGHLR